MRTFTLSFVAFAILAAYIPTAYATCKVVKNGSPSFLYICGTLLTPSGPIRNGHIAAHSHRIHSVGYTCDPSSFLHSGTVIDCGSSIISPGFINAHEHIDFSTVHPLRDDGTRVSHRHDWRRGTRGNTARDPPRNGTELAATTWGELRHIFSGTTSVVGGAMAPGLARNLDFADGLGEGLATPAAVYATFPLDDKSGILRSVDCDYGPRAVTEEVVAQYPRYIAHVSEGIDTEAANEFRCLSSSNYDTVPLPFGGGVSADIIHPNVALIHALGLDNADFDLVAKRGAHVIWSPRSNVFLYGKTLGIGVLLEKGVNVALATDWLPSGSATMGREAVCAREVMKQGFGVTLEPKLLWEMMTVNAAKATGFQDHLGSLEVGKLADIVVFEGGVGEPYAKVVYGSPESIELVVRGGKVLVASEALKELAQDHCERAMFGHVPKIICVAGELGKTYGALEKELGGVYPAILPGVPPDEPSCEPTR